MVKNTYGTGCFMLMNTGTVPVDSKHVSSPPSPGRWEKKWTYALEGAVFIGGALMQWMRDGLEDSFPRLRRAKAWRKASARMRAIISSRRLRPRGSLLGHVC